MSDYDKEIEEAFNQWTMRKGSQASFIKDAAEGYPRYSGFKAGAAYQKEKDAEEIKKLEVLNKIKQNRNDLLEMYTNKQKENAELLKKLELSEHLLESQTKVNLKLAERNNKLDEQFKEAVFILRHSLNSHQISCEYILNKDREKCDCAYGMALKFLDTKIGL